MMRAIEETKQFIVGIPKEYINQITGGNFMANGEWKSYGK